MSMKPQPCYTVPEETARVARAIFPKGNLYMRMYDIFGALFEDEDFAALFSTEGQPALSPIRLVLVLILQFAEGLSDRQAAEAVRTRIDWKYLLCLELTDPGFHYSVLSEFRTRLIVGSMEQMLLDKLLSHFAEHGLLKARGRQRTDSTHILGAVRTLHRLELVVETMRQALNTLAVTVPDWMRAHSIPEWVDRYGPQAQEYRLPREATARQAYGEVVGADGLTLLVSIGDPTTPAWLRDVPAVQILRQVWIQNYTWTETGKLRWRQADELPPASLRISSPYDPEVHFCIKRSTKWLGYKVHLTETCDEDAPRLITHVETTLSTAPDTDAITPTHESLQEKDLLPTDHLVDTGYMDTGLLVTSQEDYGVNLVCPTRPDTSWQARQEGGLTVKDFEIDWTAQQATCPAGKQSQFWMPAIDIHGREVIQVKFAKRDCRACAMQARCTRANPPRRTITILPETQHKALQAAREREHTDAFKEQYAQRAGVEGTISQGVRAFDLRRTRYTGLAKTHLQHVLTAAAIDLVRAARWLAGEVPAQSRRSAFVRLHAVAAA